MKKHLTWPNCAVFAIFIFFALRLETINLAPMDVHYFRQALTLGVARNFIEWDPNIFHPRTILCDSRQGFTVGEYPIYNYCISILWRIFGQHDWCYRLFTLIVSSFGLWYFYLISKRITSERAAVAAMTIFAVSIAFMYSRKAMPDLFSLSLVVCGVFYGWVFLEKGKLKHLVLFSFLSAIGILSKIPSATILGFLVYPFLFQSEIPSNRKLKLFIGGLISGLAVFLWYFVWIPWAEKQYSTQFFFDLTLSEAWYQIFDRSWHYTKERFFPIALQSRLAYLFVISGFVFVIIRKNFSLIISFLSTFLLFGIFALQVGEVFSLHEYYIIPFVPSMALLAGFGLSELIKKDWIFVALLIAISAEALHRTHFDFFIPEYDKKFLKVKEISEKNIPFESRIMVVSEPVYMPSMMFLAHRKGWQEFNLDRINNRDIIVGESTVGLDYILADRSKLPDSIDYPMVYEDPDFRVFKIKGAQK